jgi:hypothetical protein
VVEVSMAMAPFRVLSPKSTRRMGVRRTVLILHACDCATKAWNTTIALRVDVSNTEDS